MVPDNSVANVNLVMRDGSFEPGESDIYIRGRETFEGWGNRVMQIGFELDETLLIVTSPGVHLDRVLD